MTTTPEPHKKIETDAGLPNFPEQADQAAVSDAIRADMGMRSAQVLELGNAMPQIEEAQAAFLEQMNSSNPDKKLIKAGTRKIADNTVRLMQLAHEGQEAQMEALDGEKKVTAEKWRRDQEIVRRQRAEETSNKWLSWISALGKQIGQGIGGGLAGIIYAFKERRAESLAKRNRTAI